MLGVLVLEEGCLKKMLRDQPGKLYEVEVISAGSVE